MLVTFTPDCKISLLDFVGLEQDLEEWLHREVDLVEKETVKQDRNWIRRNEILNNHQVIYSVTVMGEATKKLSPEFRAQNPQIPWKKIAGMRDKCVHDYRQINSYRVWEIIQTSIPELLQSLEALLPTED
jgi:uncharacterized protein with HEPN domain